MKLLAARNIPDAGRVVIAACQDLAAVRAEGHELHRALMRQLMKLLAARYIPDAGGVVIAARRTFVPSGLKATEFTGPS